MSNSFTGGKRLISPWRSFVLSDVKEASEIKRLREWLKENVSPCDDGSNAYRISFSHSINMVPRPAMTGFSQSFSGEKSIVATNLKMKRDDDISVLLLTWGDTKIVEY